MRHSLLSVPVCILLCTSAAHAQWTENFDTLPVGPLAPQAGWENWSAGAEGWVEATQARSGPNSVTIGQARGGTSTLETDLICTYSTGPGSYDSGLWVYRCWQYIPSTMTGTTYFILLNTYNTGGPYNWSVQVEFDAANMDVEGDCGASNNWNVPLTTNAWVELKVIIDLDNNTTQVFYGCEDPSPVYSWTGGVFGGGTGLNAIGAVDLYGNSGTDCYYDDMSLQPLDYEPVGCNPPSSVGPITFTQILPASILTGAWVSQFDGLPSPAYITIIGLNNTSSPAGSLPMDLGPFGMPGYFLRVSNDALLFGVAAPSGTSTYQGAFSMGIPGYLGLDLFQQIFYLDAGLNTLGAGISGAMFTRITL
jgi:hypothetical protein